MDAFVKLSPEDRRIFFEGAAAPLNLAPLMVEKDFWVCWTLRELALKIQGLGVVNRYE